MESNCASVRSLSSRRVRRNESSRVYFSLAARHRMPVISTMTVTLPRAGGLLSYGPDVADVYGARPVTSIGSSKARNRPTCRCVAPTKW